MSLETKSNAMGKKKVETLFHLLFIGLAVLGCILNIRNLSERKEKATYENVEIFRSGYTEAIRKVETQLEAEASLPSIFRQFSMVKRDNGFSILDLRFSVDSIMAMPAETPSETHPMLLLIEDLVLCKVNNPFLFGFKDIGMEVTNFLDRFFETKGLINGLKENQVARLEIENFIKSRFTQEQYTDVFGMFYFMILDIYSSIDINQYIEESKGILLDRKEYIISACYLGEIVSLVLGNHLSAFEFLPSTVNITEKDFLESKTRQSLNKGSIKF